jgi:FtsP/CotA-like multicopper oxidase with cupredoxin domain
MLVGTRPAAAVGAPPLIRKWVDPLAIPPVVSGSTIEMSMTRSSHTFHSSLAASSTLAYRCTSDSVVAPGTASAAGYLGPTIVATTGQPLTVRMVNSIASTGGHPLPIDTTTIPDAQVADQRSPRTSTHLHGGNTRPAHDGGPEDDFRDEHTYVYDNSQDAAGLWYHDHAIGITRVNVYAGLAGGYLIRDTATTGIDTGAPDSPLPTGRYEIPLIIQDKTFSPGGEQVYDDGSWVPEFFGSTPVVNGIAYPHLTVQRGVYRFRTYNGSNARFYRLVLKVKSTGAALPFLQVGSDGGLLNSPVPLTTLVLGPGERADLLVDFSGLTSGELVEMGNNAPTPFPFGPRNLRKGGVPLRQIMQFRVTGEPGWVPPEPLAGMDLRPITPVVRLDDAAAAPGVRVRSHSLVEIMGPDGPVMALLNNRVLHDEDYADPAEAISPDSLEVWELVNTTVDAHPIHLHLVQFQVLDRQGFEAEDYLAASGYETDDNGWLVPGTGPHPAPSPTPYLTGARQRPPRNERGWKDTVVAPPGMVTRIAVPFGSGAVASPIAARAVHVPDYDSGENDYVWHCHILEHEEKEMMQYYRIAD